MRFGVIGTGMVGHALSTRLVEVGHEVTMGSRAAGNEKAVEWAAGAGSNAHEGSFADAAAFGEVVINATAGAVAIDALTMAGADNLAGKVLIDISNPLSFGADGQPNLIVCNTDSIGEQVQRAFPEARVVKTLNMMTSALMVHPEAISGGHTVFLSGNDADAKAVTVGILESFGWSAEQMIDLGDIVGARSMEMFFPLWLRMAQAMGNWAVTIKVVSAT